MIATNKRLLISESRGDSNRYTPCRGKPDQHNTYASHSSPRTPGVRFLQAVPVCDNILLAPTKSKQAPTPGRSLGNQRQKQRLNPRNYFKQELIMKSFVWSNNNGMHMHAKIQSIIKCRYLQTNILVFKFLQFCTINYCIKVSLVNLTV
jgi:hypothetical protein